MIVEKEIISKNKIISSLLHIGHGDLSIYSKTSIDAANHEPELFAHLISWNSKKGEVRDSKVAFPVCALRGKTDLELFENAVANLCLLDPRNLVRAVTYNKALTKASNPVTDGAGKMLKRGMARYIEERQNSTPWLERTLLQHKVSMKSLYATFHVKPNGLAQSVLFKRQKPKGSVFEAVANLKNMSPLEAAGTILNRKIPFTIVVGALGGIKDKPDVIIALLEKMSGNEIMANTNLLTKWGVFDNPVLESAYDSALERAKKDKRASTLKAGKSASVATSAKATKKLEKLQESKLDSLGGIEGDWLILGDKSGSMQECIEAARNVSALIAQQVKGDVHLLFFDTRPTKLFSVKGKTLEEIKTETARIYAGGGTSIGVGLDYILSKGMIVNGIAIVSDGGENTSPRFCDVYSKYVKALSIEPTVYHFHVPGEQDRLSSTATMSLEKFELGRKTDYYSLPNIIKTLRANRYQLVDEIMETPLLKLDDVFKKAA